MHNRGEAKETSNERMALLQRRQQTFCEMAKCLRRLSRGLNFPFGRILLREKRRQIAKKCNAFLATFIREKCQAKKIKLTLERIRNKEIEHYMYITVQWQAVEQCK